MRQRSRGVLHFLAIIRRVISTAPGPPAGRRRRRSRSTLDVAIAAKSCGEATIPTRLADGVRLLSRRANGRGEEQLGRGFSFVFFVRCEG